ncbi:hypothetical protein HYV80_06445 [Candidatus Woesearchaeota archaeon]|nr:hypothetical protein [Candidatus Woesearchaeota archaeon]
MDKKLPDISELPESQRILLRRGGKIKVPSEKTIGFLKLYNKNIRGTIAGNAVYAILNPEKIDEKFRKENQEKIEETLNNYLKIALKDMNKQIDLHKVNENICLFDEGIGLGIYVPKLIQQYFRKESTYFSDLLYGAKYNRNLLNLSVFSKILSKNIRNFTDHVNIDYLIFMPYSHKGSKSFFPLEIIEKEIQKQVNIPIFRIINTSQQENLKYSTWAHKIQSILPNLRIDNPEKLKFKNIILIDDIYNTGAHLAVACIKLRQASVNNIFVLTLGVSDNVKNDLSNEFDWEWLDFYNERKETNMITTSLSLITLNYPLDTINKKTSHYNLKDYGIKELLLTNTYLKKMFRIHVRYSSNRRSYVLFIEPELKEKLKSFIGK